VERVLFAPRTLPPLRPNVGEDPVAYDTWVRRTEAARLATWLPPPNQRALHVVMVIEDRPPTETIDSLRSLTAQTSSHWALTVALRERWEPDLSALLHLSGIRQHFALERRDQASTFEEMLGAGLAAARDSDVALMFPGDVWAPDTVSQLSEALTDNGVAYADEDCLDDHGTHAVPCLKPAFSPEFLLHADCIGRPLAMSAGVVGRLPTSSAGVREARDHDLALRACEVADSVRHVPEVLCHRRVRGAPLPTQTPGSADHVTMALARRHELAAVTPGRAAGTFSIRREPSSNTTASIIIPFRDEPRFLRACIDSIDRTKGAVVHEFLLVDNGSVQPETMTLLDRLSDRPDVRVVSDPRPFNWAALNNGAAAMASGDVLVFLNNDIEALSHGWLDALCGQAERPDVGAVGARLLYPDHRLQHCGVVLGLGGAAGHLFVGLAEDKPGYLGMAVTTRECSAVTGACLTTRREVFDSHGQFDESLGVDLNDIDYCLRMHRSGLRTLYEPAAELVHHESPSRGTAGDVSDIVRFVERWKASIIAGDPYLNPHLTRIDSSCALRGPGEEEWWQRWHDSLTDV